MPGVKLLVVACNTASAAAARLAAGPLRGAGHRGDRPGVTALVQATVTGRVGVVGTVGRSTPVPISVPSPPRPDDAELIALACPGFVEFVERGEFDSSRSTCWPGAAQSRPGEAKVDTAARLHPLPHLARTLNDVMGRDVVLVSSADETAFEVRRVLSDLGLARPATGAGASRRLVRAPSSSPPVTSAGSRLGRRLLGPKLDRAESCRGEVLSS